ncbi:MAG: carboxypeptidase-like regulatory domain-containing protein [Chitinophagaceae bacterium]|nr:carboxypeptidase-like regulatory domain-containing protein [Chitinophagaceae bacterium]
MENDNNIKTFTAADIEKYHKGLLTPAERNALEKAALDDPFLADALEGYAIPGVTIAADIDDLKKRLAERTAEAIVVKMEASGGKAVAFPWLRIAAAVVIIGGVAALANQLFYNPKKTDIAQAPVKTKTEEPKITDTSDNSSKPVNVQNNTATVTTNISKEITGEQSGKPGEQAKPETTEIPVAKGDKNIASVSVPKPVISDIKDAEVTTWEKVTIKQEEKKELAKEEVKSKAPAVAAGEADVIFKEQSEKGIVNTKNAAMAKKAADQYKAQQVNIFRGRVTDTNNTGLPFARVYNPADRNAGTYTDANGYFNLTYPDTVLNIQVKALGFENANIALKNNIASNKIMLSDDRSLNEFVINNQRANSNARAFDNNKNRTLEEPEPADGWDNYDTYIANNLNIPQEGNFRQKNAGYVQVSFEVDKNGEAVNITVDKSLCSKCDEEAIRLIKEGPKWKRSAKKHGRTTVIINF